MLTIEYWIIKSSLDLIKIQTGSINIYVVAQTDPCPKSALGYPKSNILISDIPNRNFYLCPKSNLGYPKSDLGYIQVSDQ